MIFNRSINILLRFIAFSLIALSCTDKAATLEEPFSVTIYDSDFSLALANIYKLDMSRIRVIFAGGIEGETDSVVYEKLLSEEEQGAVTRFFSDFPLSALEDEYVNPNMDDGDQKIFVFEIGTFEKRIIESNVYQEDLGSLVDFINELVTEKYKMRYLEY